jgi:hypothetical protein
MDQEGKTGETKGGSMIIRDVVPKPFATGSSPATKTTTAYNYLQSQDWSNAHVISILILFCYSPLLPVILSFIVRFKNCMVSSRIPASPGLQISKLKLRMKWMNPNIP